MSSDMLVESRYQVERELGRGAMSTVYLARDHELERPVALKVLDDRVAGDDGLKERFVREARLAASLSHPNVVTIFDTGQDEGRPYIVMECVDGRTLAERLDEEGPLPPAEIAAIGAQICAGLEHAHAAGLVHRDLKPGNLIERSEDGTIKIADFGIAHAADVTGLTETGTILGTASYLAPEQADGGQISPATDLYALGVVLYELVAGRPPFSFGSLAEIGVKQRLGPPPPLRGAPEWLEVVILRCLAPEPDDRPASAAEVRRALEAGGGTTGADEPATMVMRPGRPTVARRRTRMHLGAPIAAIVVVVLLAVAGALLLQAALTDEETPPPAESGQIAPLQTGGPPAEDARNLADWLRDNSG
jgi:eukaryotic-like serine/threonine-protein kinase